MDIQKPKILPSRSASDQDSSIYLHEIFSYHRYSLNFLLSYWLASIIFIKSYIWHILCNTTCCFLHWQGHTIWCNRTEQIVYICEDAQKSSWITENFLFLIFWIQSGFFQRGRTLFLLVTRDFFLQAFFCIGAGILVKGLAFLQAATCFVDYWEYGDKSSCAHLFRRRSVGQVNGQPASLEVIFFSWSLF